MSQSFKLAALTTMWIASACASKVDRSIPDERRSAVMTACTDTSLPTWPSDWRPALCHDTPAADPEGDTTPAVIDGVGDPEHPAVLSAMDDTFLYMRIRTNQPVSNSCTCASCPGGPITDSHGWGYDFDIDGNPATYEFQLLMNGGNNANGRTLQLNRNTVTDVLDDPAEKAEIVECEFAGARADALIRVSRAGDGSNFGGDCDFFVDMAFPLSELAKRGINMKAARMVWAGSSAQAQNLSGDLICDAGGKRLSPSSSGPTPLCLGACCTEDAHCMLTRTTVSEAMTADQTTAPVVSTNGYPSSGLIVIDGEAISYAALTANSFTGLARGRSGTTASTHNVGSAVRDAVGEVVCNASRGICECSTEPDSCPSGQFCDPKVKMCRPNCTSAAPQGGSCATGGDVRLCCDDGNPCTSNACTGGKCSYIASNDGATCNDNSVCTGAGSSETARCQGGQCGAANSGCASDNHGCTSDVCRPWDGACLHLPMAVGEVCRPAAGQCDRAEVCDGTALDCPNDVNQPDGTVCEDGTLCTSGERCHSGLCGQPTRTVMCDPPPDCRSTVGAVCNAGTGLCSYPNATLGQPCASGVCNCATTVCDMTGGAPGICEAANTCGNGTVESGEGCDDGGTTTGDGCTSSCRIANGAACNLTAPGLIGDDSCASGVCNLYAGASGVCMAANLCGNGKLEPGEGCDDGNVVPGDHCSAACRVESEWACNATAPGLIGDESCASGICNAAAGDHGVCVPANACGNAVLEVGEGCDDGNSVAGDGCSVECYKETGRACNATAPGLIGAASCASGICNLAGGGAGVCMAANACGNSRLEAAEGCDDGNRSPGDGCNESCYREVGTACNGDAAGLTGSASCASGICNTAGGQPGACAAPNICGNHVLEAGEGCDDGNRTPGDGCDSSCLIETGRACLSGGSGSCASGICNTAGGQPGVCAEPNTCGNHVREAGEGCDDGNAIFGDGCSAACLVETGSACSTGTPGVVGSASCVSGICNTAGGAPGVCAAANSCGNGRLEAGEGCDDGNTAWGDRCGANCRVITGETCNTDPAGLTGNASCVSGICNDAGGAPGMCAAANVCGNGVLEVGEGCDDGGTIDGGGCSAVCLKEVGAACNADAPGLVGSASCASGICNTAAGGSGVCAAANSCGNSVLEAGEGCDSGGATNAGWCDASCKIEDGTACNASAPGLIGAQSCESGICNAAAGGSGVCMPANVCGNGVREGLEGCDDGNAASGDGCIASCLIENDYGCLNRAAASCASGVCNQSAGPSGRCAPAGVCGNGSQEGGEGCDDGNMVLDDGCNTACRVEDQHACDSSLGSESCASGRCDVTGGAPGLCAAMPATIVAVDGGGQVAAVLAAFTVPLTVEVRDAAGNPLSGVVVTFAAATTGPSAVVTSAVTTGATGRASVTATANALVGGPYLVSATVAGVSTPAVFSLSNGPGAPDAITVVSGSSQSTTVLGSFPSALIAEVTDALGNPVPGTTVTWTVPSTGASAATASSSTTDASGRVAIQAQANALAGGPYSVSASVSGVAAPAVFVLTNRAGAPAQIAVSGGDGQQTVVMRAFAQPFEVVVTDALGNPVAGATVVFVAPAAGATAVLESAAQVTDSAGHARVSASAGWIAGAFELTASIVGSASKAAFAATNLAGTAVTLRAVSGAMQTAQVGSAFAEPLVAVASDTWGNAVVGAHVMWTAPTTGASATGFASDTETDAGGRTSVNATAGTAAGSYPVTARLTGGQQVDFVLSNANGPVLTVTAESGSDQTSSVVGAFTLPLVALVTSGGSPVAGVKVTVHSPEQGATATFSTATAVTDAAGRAQLSATAGTVAGSYQVLLTAPGAVRPAVFVLSNTAGPASSISAVASSTPQGARVGTAFARPIAALVRDAHGNAVPGASVTFSGPSVGAGASLTPSGAVATDQSGVASVTAVANESVGGYTVTASAPGVTGGASFALRNLSAAVQIVTVVSGSPQQTVVGTFFEKPAVILVSDLEGAPVANAVVNFHVPPSGATAIPSATAVTTDVNGRAQISLTAGSAAGAYEVTASTEDCTAAARFELANAAGEPVTVVAVSGTPQAARVGTAYAKSLQVLVTDAFDNPVPGIITTFSSPTSGPTAALTVGAPATDALGLASVVAIASNMAGRFSVNAVIPGGADGAQFALANLSGEPAAMTLVGGGDQRTSAGQEFPAPLTVKIADAAGNPVSGVAISISLPASGPGASIAPDQPVTGDDGTASIRLRANEIPGRFTVSVASEGLPPLTAAFTVTAVPTTTSLAIFPTRTTEGEPVSLSATVMSADGPPEGTVTFAIDGRIEGTAPVVLGVASLTVSTLAVGEHEAEAHYGASSRWAESQSGPVTLSVVRRDDDVVNGGGGCSTAGGDPPALIVLLLIGMVFLRRSVFRLMLTVGFSAALAFPSAGQAQTSPGAAINVFHSAPAGSEWLAADSLDLHGRLRPGVRLLLDYAHDPLVVYQSDGSRRFVPIRSQTWLAVGGSVVLVDRLRLSFIVPAQVYQSGDRGTVGGASFDLASAGVGDITAQADLRVLGGEGGAFRLAVGGGVVLPSGSQSDLLGDSGIGGHVHLAAAGDAGVLAYAARAGYAFRNGQVADRWFNDEVRFSTAAGFRLLSRRLLIGPELFGAVDIGSGAKSRPTAVELDVGAHLMVTRDWRVGLGAGTGLHRSPGIPDVRLLASVDWSPSRPPAPPAVVTPPDRDGDDIPDAYDACPGDAGPGSSDASRNGCPPPRDRDRDGVPDQGDQCPETPSGAYPDADRPGCPERDSDGDGVLDIKDACPEQIAGSHPDGNRPGCPDVDRDGDGIYDSADLCPEAHSGPFADASRIGCPLPDRDLDQVPDESDACPEQAGAPHPDRMKNGCPGLVTVSKAQILIFAPINFETGKDTLLSSSDPVLEAVANAMKAMPHIKQLSIEGHTDARGSAAQNLSLSGRRAARVRQWLIEHGVAADRLEAHGYGQSQPIADNKSAAGRAKNRRVEFRILVLDAAAEQ